jgi:hypothetical protein
MPEIANVAIVLGIIFFAFAAVFEEYAPVVFIGLVALIWFLI